MDAQKYHFEIAVIDEDEALDEIVCGLNIFDLKREIQQKVISHSKYYLPLEIGTIGWNVCFENSKNKYIVIKSNDELKNAVYENTSKRNFKLLVKFKDVQKYNVWKEGQVKDKKYSISLPSIDKIVSFDGYFKCFIDYPADIITKSQYVVQYQIKRVAAYKFHKNDKAEQSQRNSTKSINGNELNMKPNKVRHHKSHSASTQMQQTRHHRHLRDRHEITYKAESSPFIIRHHIWPYSKYKFRVRLVSKLFPSQKSGWTKWSERQLARPPSINDLISTEKEIQNKLNNEIEKTQETETKSLSIKEFEQYVQCSSKTKSKFIGRMKSNLYNIVNSLQSK